MATVKVISNTRGVVSVRVPAASFQREWMDKGSFVNIEEEKLQELLYDPGFSYMINNGLLYIEDMQVKKNLGLEPEDATKPTNIIVLSDSDMKKYLTTMSLKDFKENTKKLNYEQLQMMCDFAIVNKLIDVDKCAVLKKLCGKDIMQTIRLSQ